MEIDSTFWVAVSFFIFFGGLIYLKVPKKINEILNKIISDIKNEIDESEKLRTDAKILLDNAQKKLDSAQSVSDEILKQAKKDSDRLIIETASVKIAVDSVKKIISTSVDKSKLDALFQKNLDETKEELKKINL